MPKFHLIFLLFLSTFTSATAQKGAQYPAQEIPVKLLQKKTSAVIRDSKVSFRVSAPDKAIKTVYYAVTVLNEDGRDAADLDIYYDKLSKTTFKSGKIYNSNGILIRKIKTSDLQDLSAISDISIYEDNRHLTYRPALATYPYTVVYEYEKSYNGLRHWVDWYPQWYQGCAVESTRLKIVLAKGIEGRFSTIHIPEPSQEQVDGETVWTWEQNNQPALFWEAMSPSWAELLPHVMAAPNEFSYDGYPGSMETWNSLANWIRELLKGRGELPAETRTAIQALVAPMTSDHEKVARLYQYLQENFRYVSIQMGIGGNMPFTATYVDQQKYGDCKALSNYMRAMLDEVGIRSHYTLVRSGRQAPDIVVEFPSQQFNHAFLCVPLPEDTLWLECTSQTDPVGFLSGFTSDRHVLLITEGGGKIVRTPRYSGADNRVDRTMDIRLSSEGDATCTLSAHYSGLSYSAIGYALRQGKLERNFLARYGFSGLKMDTLSLTETKGPIPVGHEMARFDLQHYASKSGKRLFVKIHPCPPSGASLSADPNRKYDLVLRTASSTRDTFAYAIPEGYESEYLPEAVIADSPFGRYSFSVTEMDGKLVCIRSEERFKGRFPADQLADYRDFCKLVEKGDRQKMVFVREGE